MIIYGKRLFFHILEKHPKLIRSVYLSKEIEKDIFNRIKSFEIIRVDNKKAQGLARGGVHQGYLAKIDDFEFANNRDIKDCKKIIILVGLTDIGNIGSIIRTSYALGFDGVVITEINNPDSFGLAKSSSGALFDTKVFHYKNTMDLINELKMVNFELIGATLDGDRTVTQQEKVAIFMGNEELGLPNKIIKKMDKKITIDMKNGFDSLNVSNAAAIIMDRVLNGRL